MNQFFCIFAASYSVFVKQYLIRIGLVAFLLCATFLDSADGIMKIRLTPYYTLNGNYMAEVCSSRDGEFLAVLLFQFVQLSYAPVTDVLIFEGSDARVVKQLF